MSDSSHFHDARVRDALQQALPGYLRGRRWFGDKARDIRSVQIVATFDISGIAVPTAYVVIEVAFEDVGGARYALPLALSFGSDGNSDAICTVELDRGQAAIRDALLEPGFRNWVLRLLIGANPQQADTGRLVIDRPNDARGRLKRMEAAPSRVLGVEQSNTSLVYGDDVFVKLFRRLQPGVNPDVELTRFLTVRAGFKNTPAFFGSIAYESSSGDSTVIAVAQEFVESVGDGWSYVLEMLERQLASGVQSGSDSESAIIARRLGEVTATMHLALASESWDADLSPEAIRNVDTDRWRSGYLTMLESVVSGLERAQPSMDDRTNELAMTLLELASGLRDRAEGFERLLGRAKTRVHGDYHLGQLLRTMDQDFAVIDFEGEPQRPIEERRLKTSPLKDVAGMLRSFAYARGTVAARLELGGTSSAAGSVAWERLMRTNFLDAYLSTAAAGGAPFLPHTPADVQAAIAAWELDKTVYEVQYELNNRPDWLWIPLSGMLKYGTPNS